MERIELGETFAGAGGVLRASSPEWQLPWGHGPGGQRLRSAGLPCSRRPSITTPAAGGVLAGFYDVEPGRERVSDQW